MAVRPPALFNAGTHISSPRFLGSTKVFFCAPQGTPCQTQPLIGLVPAPLPELPLSDQRLDVTLMIRSPYPWPQSYFIPHTPHPIPHTPHPIPHTPHPTPHTPYLIPYTLYPIPHTLYLIPHTPYLIPHTPHPIPHTLYFIPHNTYTIPYTSYPIPYTSYLIPYTL